MPLQLPPSWRPLFDQEQVKPYWSSLEGFLAAERKSQIVYPPEQEVFSAFTCTPLDQVRVVLLGQDPYHNAGQAHGFCFSVPPGFPPPPSLANILQELQSDLGGPRPQDGCLIPWALQGVLLLNSVLTVRAHQAGSHAGKGWEIFTDAVIQSVSAKDSPVVFVLWGGFAQKKRFLIDARRHFLIESPHPSPLSARKGFFGSRPFSKINAALESSGTSPIQWFLPSSGSLLHSSLHGSD